MQSRQPVSFIPMKLPREFIRLPLDFDAERLAEEIAALPDDAWQAHPTGFAGNSAVPLISVGGEPNDQIAGPMAETPALKQSPYMRQVLATMGVALTGLVAYIERRVLFWHESMTGA